MNQFKPEFALYRNRYFWAAVAAVILIAGLTVSVADAGQIVMQIIFVQAEPQMIDTDGDGRLDLFSADLTVYDDGSAAGIARLNKSSDVTLKRGTFSWEGGQEMVVLTGTKRQLQNGQWVEIGEIEIKIQAVRDASVSGDLLWSDDTESNPFYFNGRLLTERDFYDEQ